MSSVQLQDYIVAQIRLEWTITLGRWSKVIGYTMDVDDDARTIAVSCVPVLRSSRCLTPTVVMSSRRA